MIQFPHAQCNNCGKMIRGPHTNEIYDQRRDAAGGIEPVYAADAERVYYQDEAEAAGLPYNVGSSMCTDCYQDTYRRYQVSKKAIESAGPRKAEIRAHRFAEQEAKIRKRQEVSEAARASEEATRRARTAYSGGATPRPPLEAPPPSEEQHGPTYGMVYKRRKPKPTA